MKLITCDPNKKAPLKTRTLMFLAYHLNKLGLSGLAIRIAHYVWCDEMIWFRKIK